MKTLLTVFLFLSIAASSFGAGITGTWVATMTGPDDSRMEITFVFKVEGNKLTGTVKTPGGEMEIKNTKIEGKNFSFEVSMGDSAIRHNCYLKDDDTIGMKIEGSPMGTSDGILIRKK